MIDKLQQDQERYRETYFKLISLKARVLFLLDEQLAYNDCRDISSDGDFKSETHCFENTLSAIDMLVKVDTLQAVNFVYEINKEKEERKDVVFLIEKLLASLQEESSAVQQTLRETVSQLIRDFHSHINFDDLIGVFPSESLTDDFDFVHLLNLSLRDKQIAQSRYDHLLLLEQEKERRLSESLRRESQKSFVLHQDSLCSLCGISVILVNFAMYNNGVVLCQNCHEQHLEKHKANPKVYPFDGINAPE